MRHRLQLFALVAVVALALAACSNGGDDSSDAAGGTTTAATGPTETTTTGATATGASGTVPEGSASVMTADSDFGEIVVDADGRTLYVFDPDEGKKSTCYDDCEASWPPLLTDGSPGGDGVDASLLGTTERKDGSTQVTLDGWPLYVFAGDQAPGDTNGQGVGEVWHVVAPDGTAITDAPA
jgi:predicted lipoprotein with Yx(FWY)xxD motif